MDGLSGFGIGKRQTQDACKSSFANGLALTPTRGVVMMRMVSPGSVGACLMAAAVFSAPALAEAWQPQLESEMGEGPGRANALRRFAFKPWVFMEGLHTPAIRAAEYLSDPTRTPLGVEFRGVLLQKNIGGRCAWCECEPSAIRGGCGAVLQGVWLDYIGRDDTSAKAQWICGLAHWGESSCKSLVRSVQMY